MDTYREHMEPRTESINYIETDIPPQMTCSDWRRSKHPARRGLLSRLRSLRAEVPQVDLLPGARR
jgi:hypothetical protein